MRLSKEELAQLQKLLEKFGEDETVKKWSNEAKDKIKDVEEYVWLLLV